MKLTISVIEGYEKGKKQSFIDFPISIGRMLDNDLQINDPYISRRHCTIYNDDLALSVSDLKSTNLTYLNDTAIQTPSVISDGDRLFIGNTLLRFNIKKFV